MGEISSNSSPYPSDGHMKTAKRTLWYFKSAEKHMLCLGGSSPIETFGFSDASHIPQILLNLYLFLYSGQPRPPPTNQTPVTEDPPTSRPETHLHRAGVQVSPL